MLRTDVEAFLQVRLRGENLKFALENLTLLAYQQSVEIACRKRPTPRIKDDERRHPSFQDLAQQTWRDAVLAACIALAPLPATAQDSYPSRLIKIVVPFPAGTTADAIPRIVAEKLTARWSQPIIVENRPGATGNIGAEIVAKADPDGYTLLSTAPPPLAINQSLYPKLGYDASKFVPISLMAVVPNVLVVIRTCAPAPSPS